MHFDSHFDTWDEYFGEKCTHGTPFKRVRGEERTTAESTATTIQPAFFPFWREVSVYKRNRGVLFLTSVGDTRVYD